MPRSDEEIQAIARKEIEKRTQEFFDELYEVKKEVREGFISQSDAEKRITELEDNFRKIQDELQKIPNEIVEIRSQISVKLDKFIENLWKAFFLLLGIVGALVGIRLW